MNWINIFGLIIVVLMLLPNILYAYLKKPAENQCKNKAMNALEQIGRYGSMFLMVFNIGIFEFGFYSNKAFAVWLICTVALLLFYWLYWFLYFSDPKITSAMLLAIIPSLIFVSSGFFLRHWLLVIFGAIFSVGHIYVTYQNNSMKDTK
ncbi:MAG: hypothetical protein K0R46_2988 [Herbinix sp.]|nr:hypothetical protein [Herbinix sp.]